MRRDDGSLRQGQCVSFVEEDAGVRKNLGRLIHTVQHIPSSRFRQGATSLWNLVGELESFQPPNSSRSVNCSQKTPRKSFSRKYLEERLYPTRDRSSSPECNLKSQNPEKKPQSLYGNNFKTIQKTEMMKKYDANRNLEYVANTLHGRSPLNKSIINRNKTCKENVLSENYIEKNSCTKPKANSDLKGSHLKTQSKHHSIQSRRKSGGTTKLQNVHKETPNFCSKEDTNIQSTDTRHKYKVLDKIHGLNSVGYLKNLPDATNQLSKTLEKALSKEITSENDQASMVKKLTSYWNNLLKNEIDNNEVSCSSTEGSDVPHINRNLQDLAKSIYKSAKNRQRKMNLTHHRSDSSVTLKPYDSFSDVLKHQKENKDQFFECLNEILSNGKNSTDKHTKFLHLKEEEDLFSDDKAVQSSPYFLDMCCDKSCGDSKRNTGFGPTFDLKVHHAVDVMEKLVRRLKRSGELSLTSDQITLSHSLRTMLCLMTATVLSSEEQAFDDYLELDLYVEATGNKGLESKDGIPLPSVKPKQNNYMKNYKTNLQNDHLRLVEVQGITMRKVEDAMRYLTLCKDYIWTVFLLSPRFSDEGSNQDSSRYSPRSYMFVIEEEILVKEDCNEDKCYFEDESEDAEDDSITRAANGSALDSMFTCFDRLTDSATDVLLHYWPDSIEGFVRTMYQTLVSLLVWWVITKEIFCK